MLVIFASLLPTLCLALIGVDWNVTNTPSTGLKNITFPFSIAQSPHKTGYFFAQQFGFVGHSDTGHAGLQPRPDSNGKPIIHAVFSSFIGGTTSSDSNCSPGADGGPGVSCSVEFSAPYANGYDLEVVNTGGTTWTCTGVDKTTGNRVHVGTWTLPRGTQGIAQRQAGFIEHYLWNDGQQHACSSLPYTWVAFGVPIPGAGQAVLSNAFEYGDCVGKVAFKRGRTSVGEQVQVGF
jgi:hypothetical protein